MILCIFLIKVHTIYSINYALSRPQRRTQLIKASVFIHLPKSLHVDDDKFDWEKGGQEDLFADEIFMVLPVAKAGYLFRDYFSVHILIISIIVWGILYIVFCIQQSYLFLVTSWPRSPEHLFPSSCSSSSFFLFHPQGIEVVAPFFLREHFKA